MHDGEYRDLLLRRWAKPVTQQVEEALVDLKYHLPLTDENYAKVGMCVGVSLCVCVCACVCVCV